MNRASFSSVTVMRLAGGGYRGELTDVSQSYGGQVLLGQRELPLCLDCRNPTRTAEAEAEAEAAAFVEQLGEQARELAVVLAALA